MLWGEGGETGGLIALAMAIGGGASWLLTWWAGRRKQNRQDQLEDAERDRARQDELYERVRSDRDDARQAERVAVAALDMARSQMTEVRLRDAVKSEHVRYLEGLLEDRQIPFRKWSDRRLIDSNYPDGNAAGPVFPHGPDGPGTEADHVP